MRQSRQRVDSIRIASPCGMDWNSMEGDHRIRFCSQCRLHVYNLSEMDVEEAAELISGESSRVCVRLYRRRDGTVLTQDCPVGRRIVVGRHRAARWGILVVSAGLVLSLHPQKASLPRAGEQLIQGTRTPPPTRRPEPKANPFTETLGEVSYRVPETRLGRIAPAAREK